MRILALIILLMTVPLASAKVYKWVDKDGNVHFTEQPPPEEVKAEEVDTSGSTLRESQRQDAIRLKQERQQADDNQDMRDDETATLRKQALEEEQDKHFQEQRKAACHSAKTNLQMLQSGGRIFELDDKGKRVYIKDAERKTRLVHFQGKAKEYCG